MQISQLIKLLLKNRGLTSQTSISNFFTPPKPLSISISELGWKKAQINKAIHLLNTHISAGNKIAIYGDYDVDGITSAAILWETIYRFTPNVFPYIPHRRQEGYGLTKAGIDNCIKQGAKLIITADNGITASDEINYCQKKGCDIVIIDHHEPPPKPPQPNILLFSTKTSAAGLSWFFSREFLSYHKKPEHIAEELTSLCALSVICDLVPLIGINRSFAKFGLTALNHTQRPGLIALFNKAGITIGNLGTYEVGFIIGPRINAMGRLDHALESLRLLCTHDQIRAHSLAETLDNTNRTRQELTTTSVQKALNEFSQTEIPAVILTQDSSYDEGIIGLIASKLVEEYYRPALVISLGQEISKGSGRSVSGFHLTEFLRQNSEFLTSVGGHEMAAGFSLQTKNLDNFISQINHSSQKIDQTKFIRQQRIDAEIPVSLIGESLLQQIEEFAPFGLGNPRPVFSSSDVFISNVHRIGRDHSHLKFTVANFPAIYFNAAVDPSPPDNLRLVYSLNRNYFNGSSNLQLIIKNIYGSTP